MESGDMELKPVMPSQLPTVQYKAKRTSVHSLLYKRDAYVWERVLHEIGQIFKWIKSSGS